MKTIKTINPIQAGKVTAVITFAILLFVFVPMVLLFGISGAFASDSFGIFGGSLLFVIIVPFLYAGVSFISGMLGAFIYNATYKWHNGIQIEFAEEEISEIGK